MSTTTRTKAPTTVLELAVCVAGIYGCFLTWEVTRERVTKGNYGGEQFKFSIAMNLTQSLVSAAVAVLYIKLAGKKVGSVDRPLLLSYGQISLTQTIGAQFAFHAFKQLDYPTTILGKSCKLIPVMLMNLLLYRRKFPLYKYAIVAMITVGVSLFTLFNEEERQHSKGRQSNSLYGLLFLALNLLLDGVTNSTQDQIFRTHKVSGSQMMVYMNLCSTVYMASYALIDPFGTGETYLASSFLTRHPAALRDLLLYSFTGAVGQCFIFHTLERFGSLSLVTITVVRKMLSVLLSLFLFNHKMNMYQWSAVGLVFAGLSLEAVMKGDGGSSKPTSVEVKSSSNVKRKKNK
ncbi:UAA transporter [Cladochytrium replicatum]|nr:UAA transporter [Cladochytrium replicatum]